MSLSVYDFLALEKNLKSFKEKAHLFIICLNTKIHSFLIFVVLDLLDVS